MIVKSSNNNNIMTTIDCLNMEVASLERLEMKDSMELGQVASIERVALL